MLNECGKSKESNQKEEKMPSYNLTGPLKAQMAHIRRNRPNQAPISTVGLVKE